MHGAIGECGVVSIAVRVASPHVSLATAPASMPVAAEVRVIALPDFLVFFSCQFFTENSEMAYKWTGEGHMKAIICAREE